MVKMTNNNLLEKEVISQLNSLTGLSYSLYHHRNVGYLHIVISFLIASIVISTNSVILLVVGLISSFLLYTEGIVVANVDLERVYMLKLPNEKKKSALMLEIIRKFFRSGSVYVEFSEPQENKKGNILMATFANPNNEHITVNFQKNYNVTKNKKYKGDIITNPPFSLIRDFFDILVENNKQFLFIGTINVVKYLNVFKELKENKVWTGKTHPANYIKPDGSIYQIRNTIWITNINKEI